MDKILQGQIEKRIVLIGAVIVIAILGMVMRNVIADPLADKRAWLEDALLETPQVIQDEAAREWPTWQWVQEINTNPKLWDALVPPPPPPPPPAPPAPKRPDLAELLKDVTPTRQTVGQNVRFVTRQHPNGIYVEVGETLNGCKFESFTRDSVRFSLYWSQGEETIIINLPRQ